MAMTEDERAAMSKRRGQLAAGIADPEQKRKFISEQGDEEAKRSGEAGELRVAGSTKAEETSQALSGILGSKKKGGPIKKTGLYKLHKGENVESEKEVKAKKAHPSHKTFYH